jgi:hypothetical protein
MVSRAGNGQFLGLLLTVQSLHENILQAGHGGALRQEDFKFEASLAYVARSHLKKTQKTLSVLSCMWH